MKQIFTVLIIALTFACTNPAEKANKAQGAPLEDIKDEVVLTDAEKLVLSIEEAHRKNLFTTNEAIRFELNLVFGGKQRFNGHITMLTDGSAILMKDTNGIKAWDGEKAVVLPILEEDENSKFDLLTWSYFFTAPYKLSDPGVNQKFLGKRRLGESEFEANRMTFAKGIGDTPDDWYVIYKDIDSDLLAAMAYIVTSGGTSVEEAEKDPHVITYEGYTEVVGIPFATQWNFWTWNEEGEMNKLLGSASVSNIEFIKKAGDMFNLTASSEYQ